MKQKQLILVLVDLNAIVACRKEYFPDLNALRDENLIGTWRHIDSPQADSSFIVFTKEGYYGSTYWVNNAQLRAFVNLDGIWQNTSIASAQTTGQIYTAATSKHWTHQRWTSENYYMMSLTNDTLYLGSDDWNLKDIYIRNNYQIIYDGPNYIGIDSGKFE